MKIRTNESRFSDLAKAYAVELDETEPDEVEETTGFRVATVHPGGSFTKDGPCGVYVGDELIRKFPSWNAAEEWLEKWSDELADEAEIDYLEEGIEAADEGHALVKEDKEPLDASKYSSELDLFEDFLNRNVRTIAPHLNGSWERASNQYFDDIEAGKIVNVPDDESWQAGEDAMRDAFDEWAKYECDGLDQEMSLEHVLVKEDANDNTKSRTESLKLTADYFLGQLRGLVDKVSKEDSEGAKLFFKNANNTLKDLVRQFEDLKANF